MNIKILNVAHDGILKGLQKSNNAVTTLLDQYLNLTAVTQM